jgi:hypothetical protein
MSVKDVWPNPIVVAPPNVQLLLDIRNTEEQGHVQALVAYPAIEVWKIDYNEVGPHCSLGSLMRAEFVASPDHTLLNRQRVGSYEPTRGRQSRSRCPFVIQAERAAKSLVRQYL